MTNILEEKQVNLHVIADHIEHGGLEVVQRHFEESDAWILLITERGLNFKIHFEEKRKFLRFSTFLPLDKSRTYECKLQLVQKLSYELFLAAYSLDSDEDLFVVYYMSFSLGLNLAQFMKVTERFSELLDHIVTDLNEDGMIKFTQSLGDENIEESSDMHHGISMPPNILLN